MDNESQEISKSDKTTIAHQLNSIRELEVKCVKALLFFLLVLIAGGYKTQKQCTNELSMLFMDSNSLIKKKVN